MKKPFWLVAWLFAIELSAILLFIPGEWTKVAIDKEADYVEQSLGVRSRDWVHDKAASWYRETIIDSGFNAQVHQMLIPTEEEKAKSRGMQNMGNQWFAWMQGRIQAFTLMVYQLFARLALAWIWAPYMLVLLVPALFDGVMTRQIKRTNFDYASPILHRYSVRGIGAMVCGLAVAFFMPVAIDPVIIPIVFMGICVLMGLAIGNLQKRI
ncbi:DUF4400 domain-containing protein [Eoetvoesiella caeni]